MLAFQFDQHWVRARISRTCAPYVLSLHTSTVGQYYRNACDENLFAFALSPIRIWTTAQKWEDAKVKRSKRFWTETRVFVGLWCEDNYTTHCFPKRHVNVNNRFYLPSGKSFIFGNIYTHLSAFNAIVMTQAVWCTSFIDKHIVIH